MNRVLTYGEVNRAADRLAFSLQRLGLGKGDRLALHLPYCPQFVIAYFAALRIGTIVVPCNPVYTARELRHQLNDSGATIAVTLSSTYPLIKKIRPDTSLQQVVVVRIMNYFPALKKVLFGLLLEKKRGHRVDISNDPDTESIPGRSKMFFLNTRRCWRRPRPGPILEKTGDGLERLLPSGRYRSQNPSA